MAKHKPIWVWIAIVVLVCVFRVSTPAWSQPIKIAGQAGVDFFDNTIVKINSQKQFFVLYKEGNQIHLSKFDGKNVSLLKNVSESRLLCYAPFMIIDSSDVLHIIWAECSSYNSDTQYIKYRSFNGTWSAVITIITLNIPGTLPGGYITRKIDTMRLAMDGHKNMFIVYQANPATKSWLVSRYGTETSQEPWVVTERHKFPDVGADNTSIHVVWQAKLSGMDGYTIKYARKANARNGKWSTPLDVKNGENINNSAHLPRLTLDGNNVPNVIYMDDSPSGGGRNTFYRYLAGSRFSERLLVSDDNHAYYSNIGISIANSANMIIMDHVSATIKYNWKFNGSWTGHKSINNMVPKPDTESVALSRDGQVAAVSCSSDRDEIYLMISGDDIPAPPPPVVNLPPAAKFTLSPLSGLYPLNVTFNAGASSDSDGQIVSYHWNFGDGDKGTGAQVQHLFQHKGRYRITMVVTDDDGATATASGEVEVLGIFPPQNVHYQRHMNRNLFSVEYLYRITWDANPRNEEVGAKIVSYKIYRRAAGQGAYGFFVSVPVGNQNYEYLDRTLGSTDRQYEYAISSVDSSGRESVLNIDAETEGVERRETAGLERLLK